MAYEFELLCDQPLPLMHDDVLDPLRVLQLNADAKARDDIHLKRFWYQQAAEGLPLDEWFGCYRRFEADRFVAESPDLEERQRLIARTSIAVTGRIDLPEYLFDEDLPIDDITVPVMDPQILDIDTRSEQLKANFPGGKLFRVERFYLPVLAVRACAKLAAPSNARTRWDAEKAAAKRAQEEAGAAES